jgi:PAS domain S-box-containing protein
MHPSSRSTPPLPPEATPAPRTGRVGGIGWRLALVIAPMAAAMIGITWFHAATRARDAALAVREQNATIALAVAGRIEAGVGDAQALLAGVAATLDPDPRRRAENDAKLRALFRTAGIRYTNLWIADATGELAGSATRAPTDRATVADRRYFQVAMRTGRFTVSEPIRSRRLPGAPWGVVFAMPIVRPGSPQPIGVVALGLVSSALSEALRTQLPPGSVVAIADTAGYLIARSVEAERYVGTRVMPSPVFRAMFAREETRLESASMVDGVQRLSTIRRLPDLPWVVSVGVPSAVAYEPARHRMHADVALLVAALGAAGLLAWLAARRIARPVQALTAVVRGTMHHGGVAPGPLPVTDGEVGELSAAFAQLLVRVQRREAELAESARRHEALFEGAPLPMLEWLPATRRTISANAAAAALYGHSRDTLVGLPVDALLDPRELARLDAAAPAPGDPPRALGTWVHRHADGSAIEVESFAAPVADVRGPAVLHAVLDVRARHEAARALEASREQLRQAQKLESLGALAGGIAHDFNNYLATISGFCELAQARLPAGDQPHRELEGALEATRRASELTRQILVFARRGATTATAVPVNAVLHDMVRLLHALVGERIDLTVSTDPAVTLVRADAGRLRQVVVNLVANARDAMPEGGRLAIGTARVDVAPGASGPPGVGPGGWVRLSVQDSGSGMSAAVRARAFEPFFTTKARTDGSGLGLAIVYGIVEQAGGRVAIESAEGEGTVIDIWLPLVAATESAAGVDPLAAAPATASRARGAVVLLVEDDASVREVVQRMLERFGCRVLAAPDGGAALELADREGGAIDLLVSDMVMPGMTGLELAHALRQRRPSVRLLFISGYSEDPAFRRGVAADAIDFLPKPIGMAALEAMVTRLLEAPPRPLPAAERLAA